VQQAAERETGAQGTRAGRTDESRTAETPTTDTRVRRAAGPRTDRTPVTGYGLQVGAVDDPAEREADQVAQRIVASLQRTYSAEGDGPAPFSPVGVAPPVGRVVRRRPGVGATAVGLEGGAVGDDFEQGLRRSSGRPLGAPVRRSMEQAFGADLSGVRVHTGPTSKALNESISAEAFTVGSDIHFRDGMPDTSSSSGQHLLAHELTHTLQQGGRGAHRAVDPTAAVIRRWWGKSSKAKEQAKLGTLKSSVIDPSGAMKGSLGTAQGVQTDPTGSGLDTGQSLTSLSSVGGIVSGQDSYGSSMKKANGTINGSSGQTDTSANQMGAFTGASDSVAAIITIAKSVKSFKESTDGWDKTGAVLDGAHGAMSLTTGVSSTVDSGMKASGKYGVDSDGAAKAAEGSSEANKGLSGITDMFGAVKETFQTVKGIVELVKKTNEMTDEEKFKASIEVVKHALEAAKSSVSMVKNFLDMCGSTVSAGMIQAVPGLGIAISCADLVVRGYDVAVSVIRRNDMRTRKQDLKTSKLGGAKGKSSKEKARQILADATASAEDKEAAEEYLTSKGLQWVQQKNLNRAILKISIAMTKIAGDAATIGGASAPVGIGLKVGALALDVGAAIFRKFKQWARDTTAESEEARKTKMGSDYTKSFWAKVFNTDKTTDAKQKEYNRMVSNVFKMFAVLDVAKLGATPPDPVAVSQSDKVVSYVTAMGYSVLALERDVKADPTGALVRTNMIKAMKKRE
jgi:hypothetical protein